MSKKKNYTIIIVVLIILVLLSIILLNGYNKAKSEANAYYTSFISSLQSLNQSLALIEDSKELDETPVLMVDVIAYINLVNDRLDLFVQKNTNNSLELAELDNEFHILKHEYIGMVRNQVSKPNESNVQTNIKLRKQVRLLMDELPDELNNTRDFAQEFNRVAKKFRPFIY
ncbi:hypothetical protein ACFQ3J_04485 [Paenibacillus provencensis]|uniref:LemA family protein n=1 Tax=Paenibacillus provencensis TaxID=441151 RepID=A0ABW3PKZ9_9BACL|nr:hypothetical protein [Paenibacillus sp. MER 78]MCM3126914.1 hypothetical protein [Paenibacillus sp. MER 78]